MKTVFSLRTLLLATSLICVGFFYYKIWLDTYRLGKGDVLEVFIPGVIGMPGDYPPMGGSCSPIPEDFIFGFPIPVRDDGTISLPSIKPIQVRGKTVGQVETLIDQKYRAGPDPILLPGDTGVKVGLYRKRTPDQASKPKPPK